MKKILLLNASLLFFLGQKAKCDRIIFNGDTLIINAKSMLSKYPGFKSLRSKLIDYQSGCFEAEWTITDQQLYLTKVSNCLESKPKENINAVFNVNNRKVKADWVTEDFWFPVGKPIHNSVNNNISFYKAETKVSVLTGEQISNKRFNYTPSRESIYNNSSDARSFFFSKHINWLKVPKQYCRVAFVVRTGSSGKTEIVKQIDLSGAALHSPLYDTEARRIINLMPMGIYYRHGKVFHEKLIMQAEFK